MTYIHALTHAINTSMVIQNVFYQTKRRQPRGMCTCLVTLIQGEIYMSYMCTCLLPVFKFVPVMSKFRCMDLVFVSKQGRRWLFIRRSVPQFETCLSHGAVVFNTMLPRVVDVQQTYSIQFNLNICLLAGSVFLVQSIVSYLTCL